MGAKDVNNHEVVTRKIVRKIGWTKSNIHEAIRRKMELSERKINGLKRFASQHLCDPNARKNIFDEKIRTAFEKKSRLIKESEKKEDNFHQVTMRVGFHY